MISEIEKLIVTKQISKFSEGLKLHAKLLQIYVDQWTEDPENPFMLAPDIERVVFQIVYKEVVGDPASMEQTPEHRHIFRSILRKWVKKVDQMLQ